MTTQKVRIEYYGDTTKYEKSVKRLRRTNKKLTDNVKTAWSGVGTAIAGVFAVRSAFSFFTESAKLADEQAKALTSLETVMKSMGRYSPEFFDQMVKTAEGLQKVTRFGDEATIAGQKFLISYREIPNELMPRATAAMLDFAAMMKGDVVGAANALGKASMGMTGELRRIGITIDPIIAKSGDFSKILGEIEKQIGGQAEAAAKVGLGPWKQLSNLWGDAREKIGDLVLAITKGALPVILKMVTAVGSLAKAWNRWLSGTDKQNSVLVGQARRLQAEIKLAEIFIGVMSKADKATGKRKKDLEDDLFLQSQKLNILRRQLAVVQESRRLELMGKFGPKGGSTPVTATGISGGLTGTDALDMDKMKGVQDGDTLMLEWKKGMFSQQVEALRQSQEEERMIKQTHRDWELDQDRKLGEKKLDMTRRQESANLAVRTATANAMLKVTDQFGQAMIASSGASGKKLFWMQKAHQVGMAVMAAFLASNLARAQFPGPPYTEPAAQAALHVGLITAAAIAATSIASGVVGGGGSSAGGGSIPPASIPAVTPQVSADTGQRTTTLNINIHGDYFDSLESRQRLAEFLTDYVEEYGGTLIASGTA